MATPATLPTALEGERFRDRLAHVAIPAGAALCLWPRVTPPWALLAGLVVALSLGNPYLHRTRPATHRLLALSIVGLGAGMNLTTVTRVGASGVGVTTAGIAICLALGTLLGRILKVPRDTGLLVTVGTAICGGSAIAAVVPVLGAKDEEVSVSLATVFVLNAVALFAFPPIGHLAHLQADRFGLWAALAIHDTSSVVGAAVAYGPAAVPIATTVKLARALWIVPVAFGVAWLRARSGEGSAAGAKKPWFIAGFLLASALVTFVPALRPAGDWVSAVAKQALVLTLFLIGLGLTRSALRAVGARPLAQGVALWVSMASLSLGGILNHLIH
ncbi:MAG: YeiH family protein [Myxococcales bacterium]